MFSFFLPFSPSFFLLEEWEEVIIQRPPAPMPQLLSSVALCLFREDPITLSGVTARWKRETEWKFIGRWRRGGEAQRKGETRVMDEFDTLRGMQARAYGEGGYEWQQTAPLLLASVAGFLLCQGGIDHARGKKICMQIPQIAYLTQVLAYLPPHRLCVYGVVRRRLTNTQLSVINGCIFLTHTHTHICGLVVFSVSFVVVFRCEIRHIFVRMMSCLFALPCEPPKLNACAFVQAGLFGREECAALFGKPVLRGASLAGLQQGQ